MGYSYHRHCLLIPLKLSWLRFLETLQWEFSDYKSKGSQSECFSQGWVKGRRYLG